MYPSLAAVVWLEPTLSVFPSLFLRKESSPADFSRLDVTSVLSLPPWFFFLQTGLDGVSVF